MASLVMLAGCFSPCPYEDQDNWLIRDNARPAYFALYDVFYLSPTVYNGTYPYKARIKAQDETSVLFGKHVRVFAPLYQNEEDLDTAFAYYADTYHGGVWPHRLTGGDRPFVLIAEGKGAELLAAYEEDHRGRLERLGLVGSWYSPMTTNGFMTAAIVSNVNEVVRAELYRRTWKRELPQEGENRDE